MVVTGEVGGTTAGGQKVSRDCGRQQGTCSGQHMRAKLWVWKTNKLPMSPWSHIKQTPPQITAGATEKGELTRANEEGCSPDVGPTRATQNRVKHTALSGDKRNEHPTVTISLARTYNPFILTEKQMDKMKNMPCLGRSLLTLKVDNETSGFDTQNGTEYAKPQRRLTLHERPQHVQGTVKKG